MHARVSTIYGTTEQGEDTAAMFREQVLPVVREYGGKGAILLVDRATGKAVGITLWDVSTRKQVRRFKQISFKG